MKPPRPLIRADGALVPQGDCLYLRRLPRDDIAMATQPAPDWETFTVRVTRATAERLREHERASAISPATAIAAIVEDGLEHFVDSDAWIGPDEIAGAVRASERAIANNDWIDNADVERRMDGWLARLPQ